MKGKCAKREVAGLAVVLTASMVLAACSSSSSGDGEGGAPNGTIDPSNVNALSQALALKLGGVDADVLENQDIPPASEDAAAPTVSGLPDSESVEAGIEKSVSFDVDSSSALSVLYAKVAGANDLFAAPLTSGTASVQKALESVTLDIAVPENLGEGEFCIELAAEDDEQRVSQRESVCFVSGNGGENGNGGGNGDDNGDENGNGVPPPSAGSNDPAAVRQRLQAGTFSGCVDGAFFASFTFGENTNDVIFRGDCANPGDGTGTVTFEYSIGPAVTTDSGVVANEYEATDIAFDGVPFNDGTTEYGILFVDDTQLIFGQGGGADTPQQRPTALDFDNPLLLEN